MAMTTGHDPVTELPTGFVEVPGLLLDCEASVAVLVLARQVPVVLEGQERGFRVLALEVGTVLVGKGHKTRL